MGPDNLALYSLRLPSEVPPNFRLGNPQVNILSKADMLSDKELKQIIQWSDNSDMLGSDVLSEKASVYREMSEGILNLINSFQNQTKLFPIGRENFFGIEDLYTQIQLQFEGGEDLMSD